LGPGIIEIKRPGARRKAAMIAIKTVVVEAIFILKKLIKIQ
jgi:hypothetical protein